MAVNPLDEADFKDKFEVRNKFYRMAREAYPNVGDPGTVWVLREVLGWDWDKLKTVPQGSVTQEGYQLFMLDPEGKKVISPINFETRRVTRLWTKAEKNKLREWWWLLGY